MEVLGSVGDRVMGTAESGAKPRDEGLADFAEKGETEADSILALALVVIPDRAVVFVFLHKAGPAVDFEFSECCHGLYSWLAVCIRVENVLRNEVYVTETVTRDSFWCHGLKFGVTRLIV